MSDWNMPEVAAALPAAPTALTVEAGTEQQTPAQDAIQTPPEGDDTKPKNPQEHGWGIKNDYDYKTFMKSSKELAEIDAAAMESGGNGVDVGGWASNAAIYEWNDEFGDVGPQHPELEKQLFGSEIHVREGQKFENLTSIDVHQEGTVRITPIRKFEDAGLHPVMLQNVQLAGYKVPTPIQQYCMPAVKLGHDIVACAQTGSGKTAAFLIPVISKLMGKAKKLAAPRPNPVTYQEGVSPRVRAEPLVLIVCPSRELATQIFDEARRFCYRSMLRPCVVYGGGPIAEQVRQLQKGCDILIGTPGRLVDFISRPEILTLKRLKYMIIDEADEMLQSDWEDELNKIMSGGDQEEGNIKYMLFSATFPKSARDLAKQHLAHSHVRIRVGRAGSSHMNIKQDIVFVESSVKRVAVKDLLFATPPARTIIFVNSKRAADELDDYLFNNDFPCVSIHSDRTQREREDCIRAFRLGKSPILIATGVSARGLDVFNVLHVINYDLPSAQYGGIEEYTHRIGRTGRIGNMGLATSFYNDRDSDLAENLTKTLLETKQTIPDFLEQYVPEGFAPDGTGDIDKLKFEADSDYGEDEAGGASAEAGWGAAAPAAPGAWGAAPADATAQAAAPWGTAPSDATAQADAPWGTATAEAPTTVAAQASTPWGVDSTAAPALATTQPSSGDAYVTAPAPAPAAVAPTPAAAPVVHVAPVAPAAAPVAPVVQPSPGAQSSQVAPSPQVPQYAQMQQFPQAPQPAQVQQFPQAQQYTQAPHYAHAQPFASGAQYAPVPQHPHGQYPPGVQYPPPAGPASGSWPPQAPVAFTASGPPAPPNLTPSVTAPGQPAAPPHAGYNAAPAPPQAAPVSVQGVTPAALPQVSGGWNVQETTGW